MDRLYKVRRVLIITLLLNILVSTAKIAAGLYFRSLGMVADGFHSFFDATSNVIGLVGVKVASRPPDESHPYGHGKYETFATVGIAGLLFLACFELTKSAFVRLTSGAEPARVDTAGFVVMGVTVCVNVFVAVYEARKGREYKSDFLIADSKHTKSDILASVSVIIGLVAVKLGYPLADPVVAFIIALMIARVGYGIIRSSSEVLCDASRLKSNEVISLCMSVPGVLRCHHVRSRGREDEVRMDLRIHVDPKLTAAEAHEIAHRVENVIKGRMSGVSDVVVHVEPEGKIGKTG